MTADDVQRETVVSFKIDKFSISESNLTDTDFNWAKEITVARRKIQDLKET